jgi:hypothetical protein
MNLRVDSWQKNEVLQTHYRKSLAWAHIKNFKMPTKCITYIELIFQKFFK